MTTYGTIVDSFTQHLARRPDPAKREHGDLMIALYLSGLALVSFVLAALSSNRQQGFHSRRRLSMLVIGARKRRSACVLDR